MEDTASYVVCPVYIKYKYWCIFRVYTDTTANKHTYIYTQTGQEWLAWPTYGGPGLIRRWALVLWTRSKHTRLNTNILSFVLISHADTCVILILYHIIQLVNVIHTHAHMSHTWVSKPEKYRAINRWLMDAIVLWS